MIKLISIDECCQTESEPERDKDARRGRFFCRWENVQANSVQKMTQWQSRE